jgi:hypothetical protein
MHKNVETVIGRLATDPSFRRRFEENASQLLGELVGQGLELNRVECDALASTDTQALRTFVGSLDRRLRKAAFTTSSTISAEAKESDR